MALPGAWNGTRADEAGTPQLIPDLQWIATGGRQVVMALDNDSNPSTRRMVNRAFARMGAAFGERSCRVYVAEIEGDEKGIDDLRVARGAEAVERVMARAERFEGWASKRGLKNAALWWEVYSRGHQGNLLERAQQAAFAAFRDGRTIPDVVEMLSKVPEYRQVANTDRFESAREFVVRALREGRRLFREYRQRFPFPIEPVRPQAWEAACQILERFGLERQVAERAKDIVLTARWEDRPEVGFPLRNEDFQVVGATYMDGDGFCRSEGDPSGYYRVALGQGEVKTILIGESPMETLKLCPRYQWTREGRAEYISLNDQGQLPVDWVRDCLKRDVKVWGVCQ